MSVQKPLSPQEQWSMMLTLQPIYGSLVREFVIEVEACPIAEGDAEPAPDAIQAAQAWFSQVDTQIQVHQLRQFLQTTPLANENVLRQLLTQHLQKPVKGSSDRDKIDFLLVQYFSLCAPSGLDDSDVDLEYVAQVLELVLGSQQPKMPVWLSSLETVLQTATRARRLSELLHSGVLEQGRKLKTQNA